MTPKLEPLTGIREVSTISQGIQSFTSTAYTLLQHLHHDQLQMDRSNMITFGSDPSCSSSGGSCTQISYGTVLEYAYDGRGCEGAQVSIDNCIHDGLEDTDRLLHAGGGSHVETPLDYIYEEIKHLLNYNSECNISNNPQY
ncbi:hypothetical protein C4D60_Mb05t21580 [Musa balbisiana]|uniref:Uncharacterized protein n=1 Tax=Musa balbisiana TaxID=52838 RepID=A0A4S8JXW1_MUSBA|nr:hypothetical protein C4D60_Mb05t21580 [Musa balbisiana]